MTKKVYIILLNYNGWKDTIECLESVLKNDYENYQIIVIDNASPNNSIEYIINWAEGKQEVIYDENSQLKHLSQPHQPKPLDYVFYTKEEAINGGDKEKEAKLKNPIIFIQSSENNGYAAGNNIGIKYVESQEDAQFIWILNNDTLIQEDTFKNLINCYKNLENENIALLGSKILNEDFSIQSIGYLNSKYTEDEIKSKSSIEVEHISGCSIFFRADKIKEIGYIPEEYFLYYEETDWMKSIKQKGFKIFTCLSSQLIHKHAKSTGGIYSPFVIYYMTRNQILFNKKYLNSIQYYLFITKMISRNLLKIIFYSFNGQRTMEACIGEYMALCEGDDYWTDKNKLQIQKDFLESNPEYIICYTDVEAFNENGIIQDYIGGATKDLTADELKKATPINTLTTMYRNIMKDKFSAEFKASKYGDLFIWSILGYYGKGKYLPQIKPARYRIHSGGVHSGTSQIDKYDNTLITYSLLFSYHKKIGSSHIVEYFRQEILWLLLRNNFKSFLVSFIIRVKNKILRWLKNDRKN